jgi:hypothetical protein
MMTFVVNKFPGSLPCLAVGTVFFAVFFVFRNFGNHDLREVMAIQTGHRLCGKRYDFVEIGTSNFNTMIQRASKSQIGFSIDPLQIYLDQLPNLPNIKKIKAAVVGSRVSKSEESVFYIHPSAIQQFNLPGWLRGCNSIGRPHPEGMKILQDKKLTHLLQIDQIPVITLSDLFTTHFICRPKVVKIDVEGMDSQLLIGYTFFLWQNPQCYADLIVFEMNPALTSPSHRKAAIEAIESVGYTKNENALALQFDEIDEARSYSIGNDKRLPFLTVGSPHLFSNNSAEFLQKLLNNQAVQPACS